MFVRGLSILLIATLLACPALCGKRVCGCAEICSARQECDGCVSHCKSDECRKHDSEPCRPLDGPCDACQCICGGATLAKSPQLLSLPTLDFPLDCWLAANSLSLPSPAVSPVPAAFQDDGAAPSAREIRTLQMSFLC